MDRKEELFIATAFQGLIEQSVKCGITVNADADGYHFSHPKLQKFTVGTIGEAHRWLNGFRSGVFVSTPGAKDETIGKGKW